MPSLSLAFATFFAAASLVQGAPTPISSTIQALRNAYTAIQRADILNFPGGYQFDFLNSPSSGTGKDGSFILADTNNFPAVVGNGMAMIMAFVGPCGLIPPHVHPRATEMEVVVAGGPMLTGIATETGGPYFHDEVGIGNATFFPIGSIHFQQNLGCDFAILVAMLNSEDPGIGLVSQAYFGFGSETVAAALGKIGFEDVDPTTIPPAVNLGQQSCFKKCNIDPTTFDISSMSNKDIFKAAYKSVTDKQW